MLKFTFFISRKGVGKALLSKVFKEAESRDIHNVYTFVRVDNKVSICLLKMFNSSNVQAGFALGRKFGLLSRGPSKHDPSLLTVEKILHSNKQEQSNRTI